MITYMEPVSSDRDSLRMMVGITLKFSEIFDIPLEDVMDIFDSNGIYVILDDGRDAYILKTYLYMAHHLKAHLDRMSIPVGKHDY